MLSIAATLVAYFALGLVLPAIAIDIDLATGRLSFDEALSGTLVMTPALFLATNLSLALMIPATMLLQWWIHGQRPRWLSSVEGRFRWGLLARSAVVLVPVFVVYVGASFLLGGLPSGPINAEAIPYLAIVVLTTPLQSAGEEFAVRGMLTRAIAAWIPPRVIALVAASVLSAGIFVLGHPNLTPGRLGSLLVVALGFSLLTWRTGGLEAAVLGHALNNALIMIPTALWGDMGSLIGGDSGDTGIIEVLIMVVVMLVSWAGVELVFRRSPYRRCAAPGDGTLQGHS